MNPHKRVVLDPAKPWDTVDVFDLTPEEVRQYLLGYSDEMAGRKDWG
jgi:hypothetical protein